MTDPIRTHINVLPSTGKALDIAITDPLAGLSPLTCLPMAGSTLAPTESMTCTADYVVVTGDLGTTITNWDRQEYIVPNKEFVTGRIMN